MKQNQSFNAIKDIELFLNIVCIANKRIYDLVKAPSSIKYINNVVRQNKASKEEILLKYLNDLRNDSIIGPLLKNNGLHYAFHWVNGFIKLSDYNKIIKYLINKYQTENNPDDFFRCLYEVSFYSEKELNAFINGCKKTLTSPDNQKYLINNKSNSKIKIILNKIKSEWKKVGSITVLCFLIQHYCENTLDYIDNKFIEFISSYTQDKKLSINKEENYKENLKCFNQKNKNKDFSDPIMK